MSNKNDEIALEIARKFVPAGEVQRLAQLQVAITSALRDSAMDMLALNRPADDQEVSPEVDTYWQIADMIEPHVQRQAINPDGKLPASVQDSVRILFDHWLKTTQPSPAGQGGGLLGYVRNEALEILRSDDEVTGVMVHVEQPADSVPVYLAARQPVGQEPLCFITGRDADHLRNRDVTLRHVATYWDRPGDDAVPVYLAPPAQAVDLLPVVQLAYGLLWMISDDPVTRTMGTLAPHIASSRARTTLRDALTHDQRGEGIAEARTLIESSKAVQS